MRKLIDSRLIGNSIKSLRLRNRLTQYDLAEKVGYSVRNLRRIETFGTNNIDIVNLFASAFDVSALDILEGDVFLFKHKKKHCRPSSYNTYSNLLFIHMHARLRY